MEADVGTAEGVAKNKTTQIDVVVKPNFFPIGVHVKVKV